MVVVVLVAITMNKYGCSGSSGTSAGSGSRPSGSGIGGCSSSRNNT